jgi:hypothetical protein
MMKASSMLVMAVVLAIAPRASAACRPFGTQLECDVGSKRVLIGTQATAQPTCASSLPILSFAGDDCLQNEPAPPHELRIQLQDIGTDPQLCRKIGNETYCY